MAATVAGTAVVAAVVTGAGQEVGRMAVQRFTDFAKTPAKREEEVTEEEALPPACQSWWLPCRPQAAPAEKGTEYDMILKIKNLEDVLKADEGWSLKIESPRARKALAEPATIKIGIMGVYNRGKTTITNLLSARHARVGNLTHTEGLSAVLSNNVAYLDTAGQNQPLDLTSLGADPESQVRVAEETTTRMLGDMFMQDMVIALSDLLVVVVNQLTLEDQRYVRALEKKVEEFDKITRTTRQLIVVHNLKDVENKKDLETLIRKDIKNGFGCEESKNTLIGKEGYKYWISRKKVTHCVIARHGSPASKGVNEETATFIQHLMQAKKTSKDGTQTNLLQGIDDYVSTYLHNYFENLHKDHCSLSSTVIHRAEKEQLSLFLDSTKLDKNVAIKKNAMISEWQIIWGAKYELDYHCIVTKEMDQVVVTIDLPGVFKGSPKIASRDEKTDDHYVHQYTWSEEGRMVLTLVIRLAYKRGKGPCIEVQAVRQQEELLGSLEHDSGKRGETFLTVPQEQLDRKSVV